MFRRCLVWLCVALLCGAYLGHAQEAKKPPSSGHDKILGQWAGTWDGAGSGKIELTLKKGDAGKLAGGVAVTSENGEYTAVLMAVTFDGRKLTAQYNFPLMDQTEVTLEASVEDTTAKGTWSLRSKGQDASLAGGSWQATKK